MDGLNRGRRVNESLLKQVQDDGQQPGGDFGPSLVQVRQVKGQVASTARNRDDVEGAPAQNAFATSIDKAAKAGDGPPCFTSSPEVDAAAGAKDDISSVLSCDLLKAGGERSARAPHDLLLVKSHAVTKISEFFIGLDHYVRNRVLKLSNPHRSDAAHAYVVEDKHSFISLEVGQDV